MRFGLVLFVLGVVGLLLPGQIDALGPWAGTVHVLSVVTIVLGGLFVLGGVIGYILDKLAIDLGPIGGGLLTSLLGVGGLIIGAVLDLGAWWDPSLDLAATALTAIGATVAVFGIANNRLEAGADAVTRTTMATGGAGAGLTLIVALNSFAVPTWLWLVLVALTVIAFALVLRAIGYLASRGIGDSDKITADDVTSSAAGGTFALCLGTYLFVLPAGLPMGTGWKIGCYVLAGFFLLVTVGAYGTAFHGAIVVARRPKPAVAPPARTTTAPDPPAQPAIDGDSRVIVEKLAKLAANPDRVYALLPRRH